MEVAISYLEVWRFFFKRIEMNFYVNFYLKSILYLKTGIVVIEKANTDV